MRQLRFMLRFTGVVQAFFGVLFVAAPTAAAPMMHLHPAQPAWVNWLFVMMGARFLGYAVGMFAAARDPQRHRAWINTMIVIQAFDWIGTITHLAAGDIALPYVASAVFLPVIFIAGLTWWHPRRLDGRPSAEAAPSSASTPERPAAAGS